MSIRQTGQDPVTGAGNWNGAFIEAMEAPFARTEMKQAGENEALYRSLVESMPQCVFRKDQEGRITYGNASFWQAIGRVPQEILGKTDFEFTPSHLAEKYRKDDLYVMESNKVLETVEKFQAPNGMQRLVRTIKIPIQDVNGKPDGVQVMFWDITEGRRQTERIRQFSRAVEQSPVSIVVTSVDGVIEFVNPHFTQVTGYAADEVLGKRPSVLKSGHTTPEEYETMWRMIRSGESWRGELLNRKRNGELTWQAAIISPIHDDEGTITHFVSVQQDIDTQKRGEQALRKQNAILDALHETTLSMMSQLDLHDLLKDIIHRAGTLVGTTHGYIYAYEQGQTEMHMSAGTGIFAQLVGSSARRGIGLTGMVWDTGQMFALDNYHAWEGHLQKPGFEHVHAVVGIPLKSASKVIGVFGLARNESDKRFEQDEIQVLARFANLASIALENARLYANAQAEIAQRKQAHEELRESENRMRQLFEASPDAILLIDPHAPDNSWPIVDCNEVTCRMNGYTRQELIGSSIDILNLSPGTAEERQAYLQRVRENGVIHLETMHRGKDGRIFPIETSTSILNVGKREYVLGIDRDITERKQIDRLKNEFISTVSHELRTPLTSIRGSLGLIVGGVAGPLPERVMAMLEIAHKNSERLVRLINDILDIEKIESGKMVFAFSPIELMSLIEQALAANRAYAEQFEVTLVISEPLPGATVNADPDRLTQVLTNLISNACKFSPRGSTVEVVVQREGTCIRVGVRDHGLGIPDEFRTRIFQKFAQADSSDTRLKGGTGLGLAISKAIVEKHNGSLWFETAPAQGTTFYFDLPEWVTPIASPLPFGIRPRILICENDPDVAQLLEMMLRQNGYETDLAYNAEQARSLLHSREYAVLTLDLNLPDKHGITLIRELRADAQTCKVPIVVVSSKIEQGQELLRDDAIWVADWLRKPIDKDHLLRAVRLAQGATDDRCHILHVEDDADVRDVVRAILEGTAIVTGAGSVREAKVLIERNKFDLLLLDLKLPDGSGTELVHTLQNMKQEIPVVIFSAGEQDSYEIRELTTVLVKSRTTNEQLLNTITGMIELLKPRARGGAL